MDDPLLVMVESEWMSKKIAKVIPVENVPVKNVKVLVPKFYEFVGIPLQLFKICQKK